MEEYLIPTRTAQAEFVEKRSTFIGHVWPVDSEEQARAHIEEMKKKYHDARHNCWCYLIKDGPVRYSDDGEPQGTAGQPMLAVFQKEGVTNACCVVTRYFGGVLLGAGGLVRPIVRRPRTRWTRRDCRWCAGGWSCRWTAHMAFGAGPGWSAPPWAAWWRGKSTPSR